MNEEELLRRASEERERIFRRYALGRAEGAEIDPWEDPAFEVYHTTDRLGFIHSERLPDRLDPHEQKKVQLEVSRRNKWVKMIRAWHHPSVTEKLHKRIYKGVPNSVRSEVWLKLLGVESVQDAHPGIYRDMFALAEKYSTDARQIDSDVNRQFREHVHYRERYNTKQQSLFNVLTAYAMYNSEVGYCQGMSGLAGVLLMYMDEEQAFWAMHILLSNPKYAMHGLYKEGFPKLNRFLEHHDRIFSKFLPKLKKHFDRHGLDAILYSLKWYFVCFVERIPFRLCLRIWDIYFLDGERVIIAMAYTILKLHKKKLMKLNDMDSITTYLQVKLYKDFQYDDDEVVVALERSMDELRRTKLDLPGPPSAEEVASRQYGHFVPAPRDRVVGVRAASFSEPEKQTADIVQMRSEATRQSAAVAAEEAAAAAAAVDDDGEEEHENRTSQLSVGDESVENAGSKFSFDPSMDDGSSLIDGDHTGSRRSLADTSVTSTADLSVFSTMTRSQHICENSLDTHSNMSADSAGGGSSVGSTGFGGGGGGVGVGGGGGSGHHQRVSNATINAMTGMHTGSRVTPLNSSPDVLRIYVPYHSPLDTPIVSPQNGDLHPKYTFPSVGSTIGTSPGATSPNSATGSEGNRIRIRIDTNSVLTDARGQVIDELSTPIVEHGQIKAFPGVHTNLESPDVELK